MSLIYIEGGQFCTRCMHIASFKYMEHQDTVCLRVQLRVYFTLCGYFVNDSVSLCLICAGLMAAESLLSFCDFTPQSTAEADGNIRSQIVSQAEILMVVFFHWCHPVCTEVCAHLSTKCYIIFHLKTPETSQGDQLIGLLD